MPAQAPLRPELASVFLYVERKPAAHTVRPCARTPGILGALASGRGLQ